VPVIKPKFYSYFIQSDEDVIVSGNVDDVLDSITQLIPSETDFKPGLIRAEDKEIILMSGIDGEEIQSSMIILTDKPNAIRNADYLDMQLLFNLATFEGIAIDIEKQPALWMDKFGLPVLQVEE
jgi:hypothetical protein